MVLLEEWSTWSITLTLQKDAICFSCKIPCFSYLKEAKKNETYLTLQFNVSHPALRLLAQLTYISADIRGRSEQSQNCMMSVIYLTDKILVHFHIIFIKLTSSIAIVKCKSSAPFILSPFLEKRFFPTRNWSELCGYVKMKTDNENRVNPLPSLSLINDQSI